ncbi:hypothetical protein [Bacillus cereus group sp. BfR-BA-01355]|uniref:hypothetical protein n=1 Tax=Bacillus cereus group sp. BfR-BA-01355 TaxID=2920318 RepID=UPI001F56DF1E|nr:hypothetical protein [Bacillus cereus group sp. BfR-BA-01355]
MLAIKDVSYLLTFLVMLLILMSVLLMVLNLRKSTRDAYRYNEELRRIELESTRKEFERKIYELNSRLAQDNNRWNETNHLIYNSQKYNFNQENKNDILNVNSFLESAGLKVGELKIEKNLVFMLTPFHDIEWDTFETIKEVCSKLEFKCVRGDENNISGDILPSIIKCMLQAQFIIVNINGRNPNVFYELGIAHALGKKTIIVSKFGEELPFDIQSKNIILYKNLEELSERIHLAILRIIKE